MILGMAVCDSLALRSRGIIARGLFLTRAARDLTGRSWSVSAPV